MSIYYVSNENGDWWTIETDTTAGQTLFIIKEDKMTRKDYVVIAEVIKNLDEVLDSYALEVLADNMAEALESDNPRFDRARFLVACGVK
jgi:hypothetical protein